MEFSQLFTPSILDARPPEGLKAFKGDFGDFTVDYDGYWTGFRSKSDEWSGRCRFEEVKELPSLPECARYCWKLLMFRTAPQKVWESVEHLLPFLSQDEMQSFKHNGDRLVSGESEGYVIVIYTWGEDQRDNLKQKLHAIGFTNIPWRRGCKAFEERFGSWRTWFSEESSTPIELEPHRSIGRRP